MYCCACLGSCYANCRDKDASQWAGFNVGASYSTGSADQDHGGGNTFNLEGNGPGLLFGCNHANGLRVIGAELAYSQVEIAQTDGDPYDFESVVELKVRAGYALDSVLHLGTLGDTLDADVSVLSFRAAYRF